MPDWRDDVRARVAPLNLDPRREAEIVDEIAADLADRTVERPPALFFIGMRSSLYMRYAIR